MEDHIQKVAKTYKDLDQLAAHCKASGMISLDFESNGSYIQKSWWLVTTVSISFQPGVSWVIPLGHMDSPNKRRWKKMLKYFLNEIFSEKTIILVYNAHYELRIFKFLDVKPRGGVYDVMLMKYLLDEDRPNDLKSLVDRLLPDYAGYDVGTGLGKKASEERVKEYWESIPIDELLYYNGLDTDLTLRIGIYLLGKLGEHDLMDLFVNLYVPLTDVLSTTILEGVLVDEKYLRSLQSKYDEILQTYDSKLRNILEVAEYEEELIDFRINEYIENLKEEIDSDTLSANQIAARELKIDRIEAWDPVTKKEVKLFEPINFGSSKQLAGLLFSRDGLDLPNRDRTKSGAPSTSEDSLIKIQSEDDTGFVKNLLKLRGINKVYTTYVKNLLADQLYKGRIHPSYLVHGTVTGRLSSRGPNFQNIPRTTSDPFVKGMFYAPDGMYFIESDFSQAELRMVAIMAQDKNMLSTFDAGKNIHVNTAVLMFNEDYKVLNKARKDDTHPQHIEMVKKHKTAKVLNFAILYGMGPDNLAINLSNATGETYTKKDAIAFQEKWFQAFPQVKKWMVSLQKKAVNDGYVKNPFGFKRRFPIFGDPDNKRFAAGEWHSSLRQSVNAPIQGAASMLTQMVNIEIRKKVLDGSMPHYLRAVSTVHDSIEFYVKKEDIKWYVSELSKIIDDVPNVAEKYFGADLHGVYFKMSTEIGVRWSHMHGYDKEKDYVKAYPIEKQKFDDFCTENQLDNKDLQT